VVLQELHLLQEQLQLFFSTFGAALFSDPPKAFFNLSNIILPRFHLK
jgi:hypothetical protein